MLWFLKNFPSNVTATKNIGDIALNLRSHFVDKIFTERENSFYKDFSSYLSAQLGFCVSELVFRVVFFLISGAQILHKNAPGVFMWVLDL